MPGRAEPPRRPACGRLPHGTCPQLRGRFRAPPAGKPDWIMIRAASAAARHNDRLKVMRACLEGPLRQAHDRDPACRRQDAADHAGRAGRRRAAQAAQRTAVPGNMARLGRAAHSRNAQKTRGRIFPRPVFAACPAGRAAPRRPAHPLSLSAAGCRASRGALRAALRRNAPNRPASYGKTAARQRPRGLHRRRLSAARPAAACRPAQAGGIGPFARADLRALGRRRHAPAQAGGIGPCARPAA